MAPRQPGWPAIRDLCCSSKASAHGRPAGTYSHSSNQRRPVLSSLRSGKRQKALGLRSANTFSTIPLLTAAINLDSSSTRTSVINTSLSTLTLSI
ncbi:hypothetical protein BCR44DRAFT_267540, partial [Catenaria anguillulae PL171]